MKNILIVILMFTSTSAWSQSNQEVVNQKCRDTYKIASEDLLRLIDDFQSKRITTQELGVLTFGLSTIVTTTRAVCSQIESPKARVCSDKFGAVYADIKSKVSSGALFLNNQTEVDTHVGYSLKVKAQLAVINKTCDFL